MHNKKYFGGKSGDPIKRDKELAVVRLMIGLYCKKMHKCSDILCSECLVMQDYVEHRLSKCPHNDDKPFCSNCKIHCYKADMRLKIKGVMRFSGPRMIFHHPIVAIQHVIENKKDKRRLL